MAKCRLAVLQYERYNEHFVPIITRARKKGGAAAVEELRAFLTGIKDRDKRDEAMNQVDRIDSAVQGNRWHEAAAGMVMDASCTEDIKEFDDFSGSLDTWADFLYDWDPENAEAICNFFGFLSDYTVAWASPSDTWRAAVPPEQLTAAATAMGALTPRQLQKMLSSAEDGDVFSDEEAEDLANWWGEFRSTVRLARRQEEGLLVAIVDE